MPEFSNNNNNGNPFQEGGDYTSQYDSADIEKNKIICGFSYFFGFLFFLPLVACPNSPFGKFHANQALLLLIADVILMAAKQIVDWIPLVGSLVSAAVGILLFVFFIMGMINAFQGKAKELPVIGHIRLIK